MTERTTAKICNKQTSMKSKSSFCINRVSTPKRDRKVMDVINISSPNQQDYKATVPLFFFLTSWYLVIWEEKIFNSITI